MADDIGLLQGISDGFRQGLQSYQQQKQMNFNNRVLLAEMMSKGIVQDANGNLGPSEGLLAKQKAEQAKSQFEQSQYGENGPAYEQQKAGLLEAKHKQGQFDTDINNPVVAGAYAATKQSLAASNPGRKFDLAPGLSAADLSGENSIYGKDIAGGYAMQAGQIKATAMANAANAKNASFADKDSTTVAKDYEDKTKGYRQMQEDIAKVESTLKTRDKNGNLMITPQQLGDVNAAIARIYSPNHMSDATVSRTEYESVPAKFAAALQKLSADPKDVGSRDLINHMIDQAHHLGNVGNKNAMQELDSLDSGYGNLQVPSAAATQKSKSANLRQRFSTQYPEVGLIDPNQGKGLMNEGAHPQDQQAIAWAQANPKDPRSAAILKANGVQ